MIAARAEPAGRRAARLGSLALVAAALAIYAQTARHGFLSYDDGAYITENPHVRAGLSAPGVRWAFADFHAANWHPLTWLAHMLDVQCFGLDAGKHHLVSAALHALNACLCYAFLRRATGAPWPSLLVALLFAVHPQRVESVAWAAERKDVLSGTFFFLALLLHERHARAPSIPRYLGVAAVFALGLLSKPMLVTLPLVLLLLDIWPLARLPIGPAPARPQPSLAPSHPGAFCAGGHPGQTYRVRSGLGLMAEKIPLLALSLASCAVTMAAQREGGAVRSMESLPLDARVATACLGTVEYVAKALWPAGLAFFYPHPAFVSPDSYSPHSPWVFLAALLVLAASALALRLRRALPAVLVGWAWYLVMLVPVIGLVQVGAQRIADRYAYLPTVGLYVAAVFGLERAVRPAAARRACLSAGFAAALACGAVAFRQVGYWRDTRTLCERALGVTAHNYVAHDHLGLLFQKQGDLERARKHYEATIAITPKLVDAHSNLGAVYMELGQRERAIERYQEALRLQPDFMDARLNWGLLCEREGDHEAALRHYQTAAQQHPESAAALAKVGDAALALHRYELAVEAYSRSLERQSDLAIAHAGLGIALDERGESSSAVAHFAAALGLDPTCAPALHGWAFLLASSAEEGRRDPARALELLGRCEARGEPSNWRHLRALAAALAARGEFAEAARAAATASALAPRPEWEGLTAEGERYRKGEALRR